MTRFSIAGDRSHSIDRSRRKSRRQAATVVEMAVVMPVFFMLVFGLVEFSRVMMVRQALTDAARAGCRKAVVATTTNAQQAETVVRDQLRAFMSSAGDESKCRISISPSDFSNIQRGTEITTTVEVNCADVSWIRLGYMDKQTFRSQAKMKRE
jgi:Flp pilus assembly protein TadG